MLSVVHSYMNLDQVPVPVPVQDLATQQDQGQEREQAIRQDPESVMAPRRTSPPCKFVSSTRRQSGRYTRCNPYHPACRCMGQMVMALVME